MSHAHAAEPDESSLFSAPFRVTGNRDSVSQQIQTKLGDYHLAQCFIEDPSKSIGICAEPPSPAPCHPSRREGEFKKPAHTMVAPQNGRLHHRAYPYNKSDGPSSTGAPAHRPPPLRMTNGLQTQTVIDSSQPPIESILKEMKSLPMPLTVIAATPRKEAENKFIFNPYINKVQENPQITNTDLKAPITKPGLDNRISNSRSSVSPDVVNKDLGLSESDDEVAAAGHRLGPPLSPIGSNSPSSGSSSQSDSESESSSAESSAAPPAAPTPAPTAPTAVAPQPPAQRSSWSLVNFVPVSAQPPDQTYDSGNKLRHVLADIKGKSSPISEMSDSEASSPSPDATRRRRSIANRISAASSDEETPRHNTNSPRVATASAPAPMKRGRPPKPRNSDERPAKKKRGRPKKTRPPSPPPTPVPVQVPVRAPSPQPDSDVEPEPPVHHHTLQDTKTHIFRKVFTPRKGDEGGGKGGKGGKGKGGKGKGQVTIIEVTAPESGADDDDRRYRERSNERRNEEALARVSPPREPESVTRRREADRIAHERIQERVAIERADHRRSADRIDRSNTERTSNDRIPERTSFERIPTERPISDRITNERLSNDRISTERTSNDRIPAERTSNDRLSERMAIDRPPSDRMLNERIPRERTPNDRLSDRMMIDRVPSERLSNERLMTERTERIPERMSIDRVSNERMSSDRLSERMTIERTPTDRLERPSISERLSTERLSGGLSSDRHISDRLSGEKTSFERIPSEKLSHDRLSMDKPHERVPSEKSHERLTDKMSMGRLPDNRMAIDRLSDSKLSIERLPENKIERITENSKMDRLTDSKMSIERLSDAKAPLDRVERVAAERYVRAEADVGSGLKSGRGSERLEEASSNVVERRRSRLLVRIPLSRLRAELVGSLQRRTRAPPPPHHHTSVEVATNHERSGATTEQTPIYFSYFERLPADALSDEERDHKYYLDEATRLRQAAEREQEPLARVMLYLESVLCFVLTGRVLELELDTKGAFTIYRETIEYIKSIHSMPQRFRASPHDTFNKLDILSLRVQSLLYLRMFKMYNREVKEYNKIVNEYQHKPALAESVSPLSPTPSPAGSVGSVGSGSASSGYCSLAHSVPAHAHTALLLLTKYYAFLYVAHDLWEQADSLCRLRANQDLFISVDRKCGPLSLSSTFRHLVQYVRYAISLLKNAQPE